MFLRFSRRYQGLKRYISRPIASDALKYNAMISLVSELFKGYSAAYCRRSSFLNTVQETEVYALKVTVKKVMGTCSADPPMKPGDFFTVNDGDIQVPAGGHICLWALQSLMPLITPKERNIAEATDEDWMWRVHHAQCPDPNGRVIFKIEQTGRVCKKAEIISQISDSAVLEEDGSTVGFEKGLKDLRIEVESVTGKCTSRMKPGDRFLLRGGRLYIPPGRHICLYALQAAIPLLPAKQRCLQDGDWLKEDCRVLCPDPAGNVILRIDRLE